MNHYVCPVHMSVEREGNIATIYIIEKYRASTGEKFLSEFT